MTGGIAGLAYAGAAFAAGFAVGTVRVLFVEPLIGAVPAVALELPLMLGVSWVIAKMVVRHFAVGGSKASRLAMGFVGLVVLVALEAALGLAFGRSLADQLTDYATVRGLLTLVGQIGFALIPLLV